MTSFPSRELLHKVLDLKLDGRYDLATSFEIYRGEDCWYAPEDGALITLADVFQLVADLCAGHVEFAEPHDEPDFALIAQQAYERGDREFPG